MIVTSQTCLLKLQQVYEKWFGKLVLLKLVLKFYKNNVRKGSTRPELTWGSTWTGKDIAREQTPARGGQQTSGDGAIGIRLCALGLAELWLLELKGGKNQLPSWWKDSLHRAWKDSSHRDYRTDQNSLLGGPSETDDVQTTVAVGLGPLTINSKVRIRQDPGQHMTKGSTGEKRSRNEGERREARWCQWPEIRVLTQQGEQDQGVRFMGKL